MRTRIYAGGNQGLPPSVNAIFFGVNEHFFGTIIAQLAGIHPLLKLQTRVFLFIQLIVNHCISK